jgi:hypothetical protein
MLQKLGKVWDDFWDGITIVLCVGIAAIFCGFVYALLRAAWHHPVTLLWVALALTGTWLVGAACNRYFNE